MRTLLAVLLAMTMSGARAEVLASTAASFRISSQWQIAAPPTQVYAALIQIGRWWNPQHSWSGKAENLYLQAYGGGCFCENLSNGGSVQHLAVVYAAPGAMLRLSGALGPLQGDGVAGAMTISLKARDTDAGKASATDLLLSYNAGGYSARGLDKWAPDVDGVLSEQFGRLKKLVETGQPQ